MKEIALNPDAAPPANSTGARRKTIDVLGSRLSYLEEGEGDPIVFLHGNPTSSYLWRNIIPHVARQGRCIAPDLIGMGQSEKPDIGYRFADHARYLAAFFDALELTRITFVLHDWGSALGFDWAMRHQDRVRGIAFMEALITPELHDEDFPAAARELFRGFRTPGVGEDLILEQNVFIERVLPGSVLRKLSEDEMAAYRAPFPDPRSRRPMLAFPRELPIDGRPPEISAVVKAYVERLTVSSIPKLMFTVAPGVVLPAPLADWCKTHLPRLETVHLGPGLHYVQEDHPAAIGSHLSRWFGETVAPA